MKNVAIHCEFYHALISIACINVLICVFCVVGVCIVRESDGIHESMRDDMVDGSDRREPLRRHLPSVQSRPLPHHSHCAHSGMV